MTGVLIGDLSLGLLAGFLLGMLHLLWLHSASRRLGARSIGMAGLLAGAALRLAVVLAGFGAIAWAAREPGLALLGALGGFVLARTLGLRRARLRGG